MGLLKALTQPTRRTVLAQMRAGKYACAGLYSTPEVPDLLMI